MIMIKSKFKRILNFIKYEDKLHQGDIVKIIKNDSERKKYDACIGKYGKIIFIHYDKYDYIFEVIFPDKSRYCFKYDELYKLSEKEEWGHYSDFN